MKRSHSMHIDSTIPYIKANQAQFHIMGKKGKIMSHNSFFTL